MRKILIFGNSGSGKSTLAKEFSIKHTLPHFDLDTIAWRNSNPPVRAELEDSSEKIKAFINTNSAWVIEGCYSDLLSIAIADANEVIFLNPGIEVCIENCKSRPWEPHKYETIEKQNENLEMLLHWVKAYWKRDDEFSFSSHLKLFSEFVGNKVEYKSNLRS